MGSLTSGHSGVSKTMTCLAALFNGMGIGFLISPAFVPELAVWNLLGFVFVGVGFYFTGRAFR